MASAAYHAQIDRVDIVEEATHADNPLEKGLNVLKSRISLLQGSHATFNVIVNQGGNCHSVRKRFSEFVLLHEALKRRFGTLPMDLPQKTAIRHFNQDKLDDRKNALNAYLKELCRRSDFLALPEVQRFFEVCPGVGGQTSAYEPQPPRQESRQAVGYADDRRNVPVAAAPRVVGAAPGNRIRADSDEDDLVGWDR
eukprot:TRINITY_DN19516_c0_g1_i1.p1 TRINITY_DN19516_c0_g1~~TRINITY_DN19516_c0_g1_i1.p1  ORF type:complete len:211 (+),score=27.56 TRINITY_DN19516_c0_g1_i1:47-634(+)